MSQNPKSKIEHEMLNRLQERLGVRFKNEELLKRALTHRSMTTENTLISNERLEFLGDSVVGLIVSENLYSLYPEYSEGELAKSKALVVSEPSLADAAQLLGLEEYLLMSSGEAASGGRRRLVRPKEGRSRGRVRASRHGSPA